MARVRKKQEHSDDLPVEHSDEFNWRVSELLEKITAKYVWSAQHNGVINQNQTITTPPMKDYAFNRIMKLHYSFPYRNDKGARRLWFMRIEDFMDARELAKMGEKVEETGFLCVERLGFFPDQAHVIRDRHDNITLNTWRQPKWHADDDAGRPELFLELVHHLLDGDEVAIEHLLDYIAHLVQRPEERVAHAVLITSEVHGVGKSTLGEIIRRLAGEDNCGVAQPKDLGSAFDSWIVGKLVVQVDEIYEQQNWGLANKLKSYITEKTLSVNIKHVPQFEVDNYARLILFSNHLAPVSLEDGDRRYFVVNSKAQRREQSFYDDLYDYIESDDGMNAIYTFLMRRDISAFHPYAAPPETEAKRQIIDDSQHPLYEYIMRASATGVLYKSLGEEFDWFELRKHLKEAGLEREGRNSRELSRALEAAGVSKERSRSNGRKTAYKLPPEACVEEEFDDGPRAPGSRNRLTHLDEY